MAAFEVAIAAAAICGLVPGLTLAGSWICTYQTARLGVAPGGLAFLLACVVLVALPDGDDAHEGVRLRPLGGRGKMRGAV